MLDAIRNIKDNGYTLSLNKLVYATFFLYVLAAHFVNHTWLFQLVGMLFVAVELIYIIKTKTVYLSTYTVLYGLFILYCIFQNVAGITMNKIQSSGMIKTLIIDLILNFVVMCYLFVGDNIEMFPKIYSQTGFIYCVYMVATNITKLGEGRLGWNQPLIFGLDGQYQSNGVGFIFAFAFNMYVYRIMVNKERKCLGFALFCAAGAFLTGSRKALLIVMLGTFFIAYFFYQRKNKIKIIVVGIIMVAVMYFLIMNVPVFYDTVGYRFDALVEGTKSGEQTEGSAIVREHLTEYAINYWKEKPIWGYGLDNFRLLDGTYGLYAHNNYAELLCDAGVVGIIIYYSSYLVAIVLLLKRYKKSSIAKLALVCLGIFMIMEYGLVSYYERPYQLYVVFATVAGMYKIKRIAR